MHRPLCLAVFASAFVLMARASAQCPEWSNSFGPNGVMQDTGSAGRVRALAIYDAGSGPDLYVAGAFIMAGDKLVNGLAKWNGTTWEDVSLPTGAGTSIRALAVHDDGFGPKLYAAGDTTIGGPIVHYDGTSWQQLAEHITGSVIALSVYDPGTGPMLYAAGGFVDAGSTPDVNGIAAWDGVSWQALGTGVGSTHLNSRIDCMAVYDDGNGAKLYVGGNLGTADGMPVNSIACWDGSAWSDVGGGFTHSQAASLGVECMTVHDDGNGPQLYVSGNFETAGGVPVQGLARWNGSVWSAVANALPRNPSAMTSVPTLGGDVLLVGYGNNTPGGPFMSTLQQWDGSSWSPAGGPISASLRGGQNMGVDCMLVSTFAPGAAQGVFVGGYFGRAGDVGASSIAKLTGSTWAPLGSHEGMSFEVLTLESLQFDGVPVLYAGGRFNAAGAVAADRVARWDGTTWQAVGTSGPNIGNVEALGVLDVGGVPRLFAGGRVDPYIKQFDGSAWIDVGPGLANNAQCMTTFRDPVSGTTALYVGGAMSVVGVPNTNHIARWDGVSWTALASGINGEVRDLLVHNDGTGIALYAAGSFNNASGVPAGGIARWNGTAWSALGAGSAGAANALAAYDDGTGMALYAAGEFVTCGGIPARRIARWKSGAWSAVGGGIGPAGISSVLRVNALAVLDDGNGFTSLYAGGTFNDADSVPALNIARWNGALWSAVGDGVDEELHALEVHSDGPQAPRLYIGGEFVLAGGVPATFVTRLERCGAPGTPFCFGDGTLAATCPCALPNQVPFPASAAGHGCANMFDVRGARLAAGGSTSPDTIKFITTIGGNSAAFGLLLKGNASDANGVANGDGVRCVDGQLIRFGGHNAGTNGAPLGTWTYPNTAQTNPVSMATLQPPGQAAYYQLFYRNLAASFCNPATTNMSNGVRIDWP